MDDLIQIVEEGICFHEMIYDEEGLPEDYIITGLNPAYEKILGLSKENVIGKRASDIYGCEKPPYIDVYSQVAKTGRATKFETYFPPMNKHFTISVASSQKGKFTTIFSDITDMKKTQKQLEEIKERLELAMDSADHGFWDWNLDTDEIYFSPRYYTMLGYEPGELPMNRDTWAGLMHPEDKKSVLPRIQKCVENAQPYEEEFRLKCKDGTWKWISGKGKTFEVDKKGIPHRALGVHEDIDQRKKIYDRTKRQRRELIQFYNNLNDFVFILDMNGNIIATNKKVELKLGYTSDELKSMYILDVHPPERRDEAHTIVEAMIKGQKDSCHVPLIDCKGNIIPVETKITHGTWEGKNVIFGVSRDISEQKKFEDAIIKAKLSAQEANRTKSEFLANMSHELRTPLNSIIGFSQVLSGEQFGELNEKQHKYISNVENSGEHLLELINGVLDLSRVESGKIELEPEMTNVSALIKETSIFVKQLAKEKNIHLEIDISPDSFEMCIDKIKLKAIIYNLLSNAIKYTPANGNVWLKGSFDDKELYVSVIDDGIGINPELQEEIFDPFIQAGSFSNKEYEGTGLGLALVKKYVEMHDGEIWIESEVGKGSTFTFTVPLK
ncbi:PAS domain S-box protein [Methanohalophilus profundi]|uniref:PAS domain S-box protein n=1 Tax=Methanohalophilus profundi TaxID=2138083 RepID=UPI00101B9E07|nr:PAS domain S-box protein [Methanohalophilus profundi]